MGESGGFMVALRVDNAVASHHILVVEDDLALNRLYTRKLTRADVQCTSAYTLAEALAIIQSGADLPDVIVMDLELPDGRGTDLLQALAALPKAQRPRVVVVSGHAYALQVRVTAYPVDYILLKPVSPRELAVLTSQLLLNR